jgi:hypothetical protein
VVVSCDTVVELGFYNFFIYYILYLLNKWSAVCVGTLVRYRLSDLPLPALRYAHPPVKLVPFLFPRGLYSPPPRAHSRAGIVQSVQRLTTSWTVRGSNPGGGKFSPPVQPGTGVHPVSYTMGIGSFPGVRRPGRGVDPTPPSAEVKERIELHLFSPSGL